MMCGTAAADGSDRTVLTGTAVDATGAAVPGAVVAIQTWPATESATSDAEGKFHLLMPSGGFGPLVATGPDGRLGTLFLRPVMDATPIKVTLQLVRPFAAKVVDAEGKPVAGAAVHFLSGMSQIVTRVTTGDGIWSTQVPTDARIWSVHAHKIQVGFDYSQAGRTRDSTEPPFPLPENVTLTLKGARTPLRVTELRLTLYPLERLSGKATTANGHPAADVVVVAHGQGGGSNNGLGTTRTDPEGRYALRVYSEQAYILTASKEDMDAPYRSSVMVRAGRETKGIDMVPGRATHLKGQVTVGPDHKSVAKVSVSARVDKGSIPSEVKRAEDRYSHGMTLSLGRETDADGRARATSSAPEPDNAAKLANIGVPSSMAGIEHFPGMLRRTAAGISDAILGDFQKKLSPQP